MDPMDRVNLTDLKAVAARHRDERLRCELTPKDLEYITVRFPAAEIERFEKVGKLPADPFAFYLCSLAVFTEMDVLYILCGDYLPLHLSAKDKRLWALIARLSPEARDSVLLNVERLLVAADERSKHRQLLLQFGEEYRGVVIADLADGARSPRLDEVRRFVDEVVDNELGAYLIAASYDKRGICDIELVPGFVEASEEGRSIATTASYTLQAYQYFGKYYEIKRAE